MATGRFAPSPTGPLHVGNLRTALLAWLFARSSGGGFLLRIEDLEARPDNDAHEAGQRRDLSALGIEWDEPVVRQSALRPRHEAVLADLEQRGLTYPCYCSRREVREAAAAPHGQPPGAYPGTCRDLSDAEIHRRAEEGRPAALRLRSAGEVVTVVDRLHGEVSAVVDDVVLRRNDGVPAYNLAVVVDDADQGVDEVVRGDDLLSSTPRQAHLADLLGLPRPTWAHVPLVLGQDGERLAKRHGAVTLADLAAEGRDAAAVRSEMATSLGLAAAGETVGMADLLERFDPRRPVEGAVGAVGTLVARGVPGRDGSPGRYRRAVGIVDEDIVATRAATDIVGVITQYTQLRRVGQRWVGLCPFHAEKTPSFNVNQELGLYRCWGCQVRGDVITFIREVEHLDFVAAVELLAGRAGITLRYSDQGEGETRKYRSKLVAAVESAVEWYHQRLLSAPDASVARKYLRERRLTGDEVRAFRVGWAPDSWDEMVKALRLPDDVLRDTGLGFLNRGGRQTDAFRGRILFPIFDANGDAVGFGGRVMPGGEGPKYKNTPETQLYQKSKLLYALNWSKARIVTDDRAIVCEGYTDVIGFARVGLPAAVATCGTALTEEHVRLLRRYARKIVLSFDADAAGLAAAEKFYQWERDHEIEVAVADLPPGVDPADLAGSDPERLAAAVEHAVPFLKFRVDRVLGAARLDMPEGRAKAAEAAIEVIREHPSELVRDQYVMDVAGRCRVEPARLRAMLAQPAPAPREVTHSRRSARAPDAEEAAPVRRRVADEKDGPELEVLRHVLHGWADVEHWIRYEDLFLSDLHAMAFRALMAHPTVPEAIEAADPGVAELLARLAAEEVDSQPFDAVVRLLTERARHEVTGLVVRVAADPDLQKLQQWLTQIIDQLRDPDTADAAAEQLVAWLGSRGEEGA